MDLFDECMKMNPGDKQTFEIDRDLEFSELPALVVRLSMARPEIAYSANRSDRSVTVRCYIPEKQKE